VQGVSRGQKHGFSAGGHEGLGDLLGDKTTLADAGEANNTLALKTLLAEVLDLSRKKIDRINYQRSGIKDYFRRLKVSEI
jgi:hypothetical protein